MRLDGQVFLFGKLPAHGDFVSRGLTELAERAWDDWASAALERLRAGAADFDAAHDAAPPWRFVAGPSALGQGWRIGALTASIDGAGRRFILAAGVQGCTPASACACGLGFAVAAEEVLYRALGERLTADQAVEALSRALVLFDDEADVAEALAAAPAGEGAWWSAGVGVRAAAVPPLDLLAAAGAARASEPV